MTHDQQPDRPYHTRVCMNRKRVTLWKNSGTVAPKSTGVRLSFSAVDDLTRARLPIKGEHRRHDAGQHDGETRTAPAPNSHSTSPRSGGRWSRDGRARSKPAVMAARGDAVAQFLADAFVDQDDGVHHHAHRQHHRRDSRQGQRAPSRDNKAVSITTLAASVRSAIKPNTL